MADEIVKLKVTTEGDQAALKSLTKIDQLITKINGQKVNINFAQGMNEAAAASQKAAEASAKEISARARLLRAENEITVAREKSYQAAQRTAQAQEKTSQIQERQTLETMRAQRQEQTQLRQGYALIGAVILRQITRNISAATDELKAMNGEMVSIQKVTGATDADMERLKDSAFEVAGALGSTPSDYLSSVTKWAQAGYGALSEQLGELSAKTQVVGDVNEETANKFLLAVDAAYKYKGNIDALTRVLDGANEISNNYATSVEKLAGGMGIVSSLAEQAGMKVEETMAAIGTITAKTQESGNSAARALRALILNIQGSTEIEIDAETGERWTEDEIQRTAAALGKLSVATREYKDGIMQLRNPMEVIGELSEKYQKGLVTEAQLQEVVASLGGKVRSNQLMALIQGYDTYVSMIETYKDAVGSADKELEIYLNGWEAKSNRLTAQWAEFIESFKATDIATGLLDFGNDLLEFANSNAVTNLISQIIALTVAFTGLNAVLTGSGIAKAAKAFFMNIVTSAAKATGAVATFSAVVNSTIGWVGLVVIAITALAGALKGLDYIYEKINPSAKTLWENAKKSADEYQTLTQEAEQLRERLKDVKDQMDELKGKGPLTLTERAELERLEITNSQLKTQLELKERLAKLAQEAAVNSATEAFNKGFSDENGNAKEFFGADFLGKGWDTQVQEAKQKLDDFNNMLKSAQESGNKFLEDYAQKNVDSIRKILDEMGTELGDQFALIDGLDTDKAVELMQQINEVSMKLQTITAPMQAAADAMERFQDELDPAALQKFNAELEKMRGDGEVTADEVTILAKLFPELQTIMDITGLTAEQLAEHFNAATKATKENTDATNENVDAAEKEAEEWGQVAASLKKYANQAQDVRDAQEELKKNGKLSFETLIGLLGKYGNAVNDVVIAALNGQATQEEISKALEIAYEKDVQHYREAMLEKEMDNEDFYASWLDGNADTVKTLADQYGVDAKQYKTFAELKNAIENRAQTAQTNAAIQGKNDRVKIFQDIQTAFENTQDAMVIKAQQSTGMISYFYKQVASIMGGIAKGFASPMSALSGPVNDKINEVKQAQIDKAMQEIFDSFQVPPDLSKPSKSKNGSSAKDWYETQTDNLKKLVEQTKRTNQVLERSDADTAQKRVDNLRAMQDKILAAQKQFIAKGKDAASDEVNQLKIMYAELGDDIESIYSSMSDSVLEQHDYLIWAFEKKANNQRTVEQIAADDAAMVDEYRKMQQEVHQLAEYYRSQGVRENDKLITNLQDKWWEYEKAIRSMYDNLTDAFNDYIDESSHKIEELGRATGNVGKQIEIYAQRIQRAQETIAALQANNINGENNGKIFDLESQIWGDKDAIRDLQDSLWDELERAFDDIFDKAQEDVDAIGDEIEAIQDQIDGINEILEQYDKELEGILKPINDTLEKLNEQLDAEKKRLEALTQPLSDRRQELEDQINGYYTINPDGSIGPYVEGLEDQLDRIGDGIEQIEEQIDGVDDQIGAINDQISGIDEQIGAVNDEMDRIKDAWDEQKKREEEALTLQKKQLAVEEAQKAVQDALLALQTARNERSIYTLKGGVWAWRADEEAIAKAEKALAEAEKAKEEAEKDLQDYKEEQAHKLILKRLEEQIKTLEAQKKTLDEQKKTLEQQKKNLEEQKKSLEEQKKLVDKQKELLNKEIEAINKQITAYERESSARQKLIQDLIDRNEQEKKAWEDHYDDLKQQYNQQLDILQAEKKAAEERKKQAQAQYDGWMDTWKSIQKSIETPARDLSAILNDIARYGTPAMADQVDRVTGLLRDLGYAIENVTGGGGYDPDIGGGDWGGSGGNSGGPYDGMTRSEVIDKMIANAYSWAAATDQSQKDRLQAENQRLGALIGANYDPASGQWDIFDYSGGEITVKPWACNDYSGYSSQGLSAYSLGDDDGWENARARNGILSATDYAPASYATYSTSGDTVYNDNHSLIINGLTLGSSMLSRPMSDVFRLVSLNMGT